VTDIEDAFDDQTDEEKLETLERLKKKIMSGDSGGLDGNFDVEGEMTVRVIDEDGNETHKQKESFEGGE
jgi:hypothetical protein